RKAASTYTPIGHGTLTLAS
ncbi:hypothetical protein EVA_21860, partial [gut metagenome]